MTTIPQVLLARLSAHRGGVLGALIVDDERLIHTFEREWKDNEPFVSCVPCGDYLVELEYSNAFKRKLFELRDVPERTECKFHSFNHLDQLQGCMGTGEVLAPFGVAYNVYKVGTPIFPATSRDAENKMNDRFGAGPFLLKIRDWTELLTAGDQGK